MDWISKASADQRSGRAGRVGPGHCYRLYSSAVYNDLFPQFSDPEILRVPLEGMVLSLASLAVDDVSSFPFPTRPDPMALGAAVTHLVHLGALEKVGRHERGCRVAYRITTLGEAIQKFPVAPRFGKMLLMGTTGDCMPYVIALVAALSVDDPIVREEDGDGRTNENGGGIDHSGVDTERQRRRALGRARALWRHPTSDSLGLLKAVGA